MERAGSEREWREPAVLAWLVEGDVGAGAFVGTLADLARRELLRVVLEDGELVVRRLASARTDWEARVLQLLFRPATDEEGETVSAAAWSAYYGDRSDQLRQWWAEWRAAIRDAGESRPWGVADRKGLFRRRDSRDEQRELWIQWQAAEEDEIRVRDSTPDALEEYARTLPVAIALGVAEPWCAAVDRRLSRSERAAVALGWYPLEAAAGEEATIGRAWSALEDAFELAMLAAVSEDSDD